MKVLIVILFLGVILTEAFELKNAEKFNVPKPQHRITNGITAVNGQFKYQIGLVIRRGQSSALCAGSLISRNWILTAAHCVQGATGVFAFMGATQFLSGIAVSVGYGIVHEQWDPQTTENDICLLQIPSFYLGSNIAPVALPPLGSTNSYINENAFASGWGKTSDYNSDPASQLQYARVKIIPNSVCLRNYGSYNFKETNICAQGPSGTSTCKGDSGGPLVTENGVLVGITSYGSAQGCTKGYPMVFTRVSSYRSWINKITGV